MAPAAGSVETQELLCGVRAVQEALRARSRQLLRIVVIRQDRQFSNILRMARSMRVPVTVQERARLDQLVPHGRHQGVLGFISAKPYVEPEEIIAYARQQDEAPLFLILDGVEDPQNLGAVLRNAEAAGAHGVFIPERRSVGLTASVARASAGALEHVRVARAPNIGKLIERLQTEQISTYACDPQADMLYTDLDLRGPVALVCGGEGRGIRPGVLEKCEGRARIPMQGQIASLNVAATSAIVLFEAVRQRGKTGVRGLAT